MPHGFVPSKVPSLVLEGGFTALRACFCSKNCRIWSRICARSVILNLILQRAWLGRHRTFLYFGIFIFLSLLRIVFLFQVIGIFFFSLEIYLKGVAFTFMLLFHVRYFHKDFYCNNIVLHLGLANIQSGSSHNHLLNIHFIPP